MASINPHINFNGNAEEAFNFYKSVFGGEFAKLIRFKDLASAEFPVTDHAVAATGTIQNAKEVLTKTQLDIFYLE